MTGYASLEGQAEGLAWSWELRSVNARGLDIRLRLPEGLGALEAPLRKTLSSRLARGSVTLGLRVTRDAASGTAALDPTRLEQVLDAFARISAAATARGMVLSAPSAADILSLRQITEGGDGAKLPDVARLLTDLEPLLAAFLDMRQAEGAALRAVLTGQLDRVEALVAQAEAAAKARGATQAERFAANLRTALDASEEVDAARLAQELAILAVKADVMEEIDRLKAHVAAVRGLLAAGGPVGRKLDFLMQEFNREANTLCSKSGDTGLTEAGLDLKLTIDQMREQVQNLE